MEDNFGDKNAYVDFDILNTKPMQFKNEHCWERKKYKDKIKIYIVESWMSNKCKRTISVLFVETRTIWINMRMWMVAFCMPSQCKWTTMCCLMSLSLYRQQIMNCSILYSTSIQCIQSCYLRPSLSLKLKKKDHQMHLWPTMTIWIMDSCMPSQIKRTTTGCLLRPLLNKQKCWYKLWHLV